MIEKTTRRDIFIKYVINRQKIFLEPKFNKFMDFGYLMGNETDAQILYISDICFTLRARELSDNLESSLESSDEKAYFFSGTKGTLVAVSSDFSEWRYKDEQVDEFIDKNDPWYNADTLYKYLGCKDYTTGIINRCGDFESIKENPVIFIINLLNHP